MTTTDFNRPEWLPGLLDTERFGEDCFAYSIDGLRSAGFEVRELPGGGWLVLQRDADPENTWLRFAVLDFLSSDIGGGNSLATCLFYGDGPVGALRECRHTYWGENGYVFYLPGKLIAAALHALSEFYDDLE